jgi:hypothetical protein
MSEERRRGRERKRERERKSVGGKGASTLASELIGKEMKNENVDR